MSTRMAKMMLARTVGAREDQNGRDDRRGDVQNRRGEPNYRYGDVESRNRDGNGRFGEINSIYNEVHSNYSEPRNARMERDEGERGYEPNGHYGVKKPSKMQHIGFVGHKNAGKIDEKEAKEIAKRFTCVSGERGAHWGFEQIKALVETHGLECDPVDMFLVLNALYCDYCWVLQKYGVDNLDVYIDLARAWIKDDDAVEDKVAVYFREIAK